MKQFRRSLQGLRRENFRHDFVLNSPEDVEEVSIKRTPLWINLQHESGPFDIISDINGCFDELVILLKCLGYEFERRTGAGKEPGFTVAHPQDARPCFWRTWSSGGSRGHQAGHGHRGARDSAVRGGNHESKLVRKLRGRNVQISHGPSESLEQVETEPLEFREQAAAFLAGLISHYVLDDGNLVVAHAGMKPEYQGPGLLPLGKMPLPIRSRELEN